VDVEQLLPESMLFSGTMLAPGEMIGAEASHASVQPTLPRTHQPRGNWSILFLQLVSCGISYLQGE
jgi:hypothetical protein